MTGGEILCTTVNEHTWYAGYVLPCQTLYLSKSQMLYQTYYSGRHIEAIIYHHSLRRPQLAQKGPLWDVFCNFKVWSRFYYLLYFHEICMYYIFYFSFISGKGATISVSFSWTSMCVYNPGNLMCFILYFKLLSPSLSKRLSAWLSNFHLKNTNHIKRYFVLCWKVW